MTEQLKAEAYVREQRPALMELTFGCVLQHKQWDDWKACVTKTPSPFGNIRYEYQPSGSKGVWNSVAESAAEILKDYKIIGRPINLQEWLGVLWESNPNLEYTDAQMPLAKFGARAWYGLEKAPSDWLWFDATTGQPATEADYKAFNDIVCD